jgi:hypothetical protein
MDKVKFAYSYAKTAHAYAASWVYAHPVATVNAIIVVVVLKAVTAVIF